MAQQIEIDDEVFALLKQEAEPFVDTPNLVLRRLLGLGTTVPTQKARHDSPPARKRPTKKRLGSRRVPTKNPERTRAPKGALLPESAYELPILSSILELGGKVPASEVLASLEPKIKPLLQPLDLEALDGSGLVRWKNRAQFSRLNLVRKGELIAGSPRGVWEISDKGRERVLSNS